MACNAAATEMQTVCAGAQESAALAGFAIELAYNIASAMEPEVYASHKLLHALLSECVQTPSSSFML